MKTVGIILIAILGLFFTSVLYKNITTYNSITQHTGYAIGKIVKVWNEDGEWYSRYEYSIDRTTYQGRQGGKYRLQSSVLIVYDTTTPKFSIIAKYPSPILVNEKKQPIKLDTAKIEYTWWNYLPADKIHSIKDLWY